MKKTFKAVFLALLMGLAAAVPISAAETPESTSETPDATAGSDLNWEKVTFKMAVPEGVDIPAQVYVMYTGADSDLFAELSAENNFTAEINAVPGTYDIYQIVPTFQTDLAFMGTSNFVVSSNTPVVNIYIKDQNGLINADVTEGDIPTDLASYGELVSAQAEAEQAKKQQEIQQQQEDAANADYTGEGILTEQPASPATAVQGTAQDNTRQTKINGVTATEDAQTQLTGLMVIGGVIIGVGILIIIFVLVRKYNSINRGTNNHDNSRPQNGNSIGNR